MLRKKYYWSQKGGKKMKSKKELKESRILTWSYGDFFDEICYIAEHAEFINDDPKEIVYKMADLAYMGSKKYKDERIKYLRSKEVI